MLQRTRVLIANPCATTVFPAIPSGMLVALDSHPGGSGNVLRSGHQEWNGYRRHRRISPARRCRHQGREGRGDRKSYRRRHGNDRRVGPDRLARLRRSTYSLRCSDLLGSTSQLHFVARRYDGRDGKLRSGYCSVQARGARGGGVGPGQRRGDSVRGAVEGD